MPDSRYQSMEDLVAATVQMGAELNRLRSALQWYADSVNYERRKVRGLPPSEPFVILDGGKRAREALGTVDSGHRA